MTFRLMSSPTLLANSGDVVDRNLNQVVRSQRDNCGFDLVILRGIAALLFSLGSDALMASCEIGCGAGRFVGAALCCSAGLCFASLVDCCADNDTTEKYQ